MKAVAVKFIKCTRCGTEWNVSPHVSQKGYVCPHCTYSNKKRTSWVKRNLINIVSFVLGLVLVPIASKVAYLDRGYKAIGGEIFIPLLFILVAAITTQVCETVTDIFGIEESDD